MRKKKTDTESVEELPEENLQADDTQPDGLDNSSPSPFERPPRRSAAAGGGRAREGRISKASSGERAGEHFFENTPDDAGGHSRYAGRGPARTSPGGERGRGEYTGERGYGRPRQTERGHGEFADSRGYGRPPRRDAAFAPRERGAFSSRDGEGRTMPIDADVLEYFPDPRAVNQALRALASVIRAQRGGSGPRTARHDDERFPRGRGEDRPPRSGPRGAAPRDARGARRHSHYDGERNF